jgi:hypothetical protein
MPRVRIGRVRINKRVRIKQHYSPSQWQALSEKTDRLLEERLQAWRDAHPYPEHLGMNPHQLVKKGKK